MGKTDCAGVQNGLGSKQNGPGGQNGLGGQVGPGGWCHLAAGFGTKDEDQS